MSGSSGEKQEALGESLPFSQPKQEALLGYLLTEEKFFQLARHRIKPEWFTQSRLNQLWTMALAWSEKYNRAPTKQEIAEGPSMMAQDLGDQNRLRSQLNLCVERRMEFGLDALSSELTDWLHARIYMAAMKKSESLFNQGAKSMDSKKFQEAYTVLKSMTRDIDDTSFEPGQAEAMDDPEGDFRQQAIESQDAISFGMPALNRLLLPEGAGKGSLLRGDMTVLLAPTNIGKTTTMVTIAALNIWEGKDVLLITHEGRVADIKLKIWQSMIGRSRQEILSGLGRPEMREMLAMARKLVHDHLEFLPLNKAGMTVEEVETIIRRRNDRWKAKHGKGFDLIIDDYAAKLTTAMAKGGSWALRQIHEVVYNYFSQIALEQNCHVVTAIQTNREGSKANNRKSKESGPRLLTMEDVMESWGPMTTATNVISINRDPVAQAKNLVTFLICKSRSSEVGWAVVCRSNYAAAQSHSPEAEATWYRGTSPMSEKIDTLLEDNKGREIPWQTVLKVENGEPVPVGASA